jgi:putative hemolysin
MTALVVIVLIALTVSFLCSLLEAVLLATSLTFISELAEDEKPAGLLLTSMRERPEEPMMALLTLNTVSLSLGAAAAGGRAFQIWQDARVAAFVLFLTLAVLVVAEILPKSIGANHWRRLVPFTAHSLALTIWLMRPLTTPLHILDRLIGTSGGPQAQRVSRAEFEAMVEIERRQGSLDEHEWAVVTNVMNLDQVTVGEVMTPRTGVVAIPIEASVAQAMDVMIDEGHLRLPVFDETVDKIVGILLARDLWKAAREGVHEIRLIVRPPTFVPFTKPVEDLIRQMREQRIKMAIVLDEFGGTAGVVTLEDLVEEIVGEIQDEHEQEPLPFEEAMAGEVRIRGDVPLWEVNERFQLDLPEDIHDTLAGYVFGQLGRIPDVGDEVATEGGVFRVVAMEGRRVVRIAFVPSDPESPRPAERG